jgi:hypothetical protein
MIRKTGAIPISLRHSEIILALQKTNGLLPESFA